MLVLVINCGSSSLKYQLINMENEVTLCKGNCERIGLADGIVSHTGPDGVKVKQQSVFENHSQAFAKMLELMTTGDTAAISDIKEISAIGHRVAHGGEQFAQSAVVEGDVLDIIEHLSQFAPLHNPANVLGIRSAIEAFGKDVPNVVVFDTTFHSTMPSKAYMYALPYEYYEKQGVRRYGFHGTSHKYVTQRCAEYLGKPYEEMKIISCHLGNGSSIAAVDCGVSVDTSMGFTPLAGLMMGTRCGDVDVSAVLYLKETLHKTASEMNDVINKQSGFLGISGISSDSRDIEDAIAAGNERAILANSMFCYEIKKYIGSYMAVMGGIDAIVFTGGIGENSSETRTEVCENLEFFGIKIDEEKNSVRGLEVNDITAEGGSVKILTVATNEELMIARDTVALTAK